MQQVLEQPAETGAFPAGVI